MVDVVSGYMFVYNCIYGIVIVLFGQIYDGALMVDVQRFCVIWIGYGVGGMLWWSW